MKSRSEQALRRNTGRQRFLRTQKGLTPQKSVVNRFFLLVKNTIEELKMQTTGREKIFAMHVTDRGLVPECVKEETLPPIDNENRQHAQLRMATVVTPAAG